jgi:hypothetical protein
MWMLLTIALVGLNLLDYQLTMALVRAGGIEIEANPLARLIYNDLGVGGMLLLKLAAVAVTMRVIEVLKSQRRAAALGLLVGAGGFMTAIVVYNSWLVYWVL